MVQFKYLLAATFTIFILLYCYLKLFSSQTPVLKPTPYIDTTIVETTSKNYLKVQPKESNDAKESIEDIKPIVKCNIPPFNDTETHITEFKAYLSYLTKSTNADDKFSLSLIAPEQSLILDLFSLRGSARSRTLIYEKKLKTCAVNFNTEHCNENLYDQARTVDINNGYLWHLIADIHFSRNNIAKALHAIQVANTKEYYNDYFFETIQFIEQNIQQNSGLPFNQRLVGGIGVAVAKQGANISNLISYCKDNLSNVVINDLCLQTGIKYEERSKTILNQMFGLGIQELIYNYNNQTDLLKLLKKRQENYTNKYTLNESYNAAISILPFDERLGRAWLNIGLYKEESESIVETIKDAKYYSQNEDYQPCN